MTEPSPARPHVVLSTAMSADGCIDDTGAARLILSNPEDLDAVDALRAQSDAILVGAGTVRADNPGLVIRSDARRRDRAARGLAPDPMKVTLTARGHLDRDVNFFRAGEAAKVVYCTRACEASVRGRVGELAAVVCAGASAADPRFVLADLAARGVRDLLIEGGSGVNALFLGAGLVDEWRLAVAPFLVGEGLAPRVVAGGRFPHDKGRRMAVKSVDLLG